MRSQLLPLLLVFTLGSTCGLETIFENIGHTADERPASKLVGKLLYPTGTFVVTDASGAVITPFQSTIAADGTFDVRLPSSNYSNLIVTSVVGQTQLLALVPSLKEETSLTLTLDARSTTEALITLARLSADQTSWKKVTPDVYLGTRALIQAAFDSSGPTADLLHYVTLLLGATEPSASGDPAFFFKPEFTKDYVVTQSALSNSWLDQVRFDYVGDGKHRDTSADFDAKLAEVAKLYRPGGCPDPDNVRVMFTVNFNDGSLNGNCVVTNRFTWAVNKPGKTMYFVGFIHKDSPIQDPLVNTALGAGVPNQLVMHDDGTGGDEVAGDNIYTIYFDLPRGLRMGYKYTWGFRGQAWSGSEEWPGNSRIIEIDDLNGDNFVYRRDVFGDEATNKDASNLSSKGNGVVSWDTILRPEFGIEAREQKVDTDNDCHPNDWVTPTAVGPLTLACTQ